VDGLAAAADSGQSAAVYRWVEHTSEVELALEGDSRREILADALAALAELLGFGDGDARVAGAERRVLTISEAESDDALLVAWLEELVYVAEAEGFVATELVDLQLWPDGLDARVDGVVDEPPPLVKAVTLHRLRFEPQGEGYVARVVLDV
jgi:SHS2 domain-containing protein